MTKDTHQAALQSYLDALLTDDQKTVPKTVPYHAAPAVIEKPTLLLEQPDIKRQLPQVALREPLISEELISQLPVSTPVIEQEQEQVIIAPAVAETVKTEEPLTHSSWADSAFECLLFEVAGLTLAVPLQLLGSIHPFEADELTPLFGQPDWFIGILSTQQTNLKVLETARWVMPERYTAEMRDNLKYVISINGYDWGLAVHAVHHSIRLEPEQVKWRTQRAKRAWLAGTVIEHMCALLDVEVLAQLICKQDGPGDRSK